MLAFLVLLAAALSRLLPHAVHGTAVNFTAVGAGLLFFGARRPRWQAIFAVILMGATDVFLTRIVYGYPFHVSAYLITWVWYAAVCLIGSDVLHKVSALRIAAAVFASATSFFLLSNFMVWLTSGMYPHTNGGVVACYLAAVPFYANDLISTGLFSAALFGLPALATRLSHAGEPTGHAA